MNWRIFRFVFGADIAKMYRRIELHPNDAEYQLILWKFELNGELYVLKIVVVGFGITCAPDIAILVVRKVVRDEEKDFPLAVEIIEKETYVDNIFSGSHTIETAEKRKQHVISALRRGQFELRKWVSNTPELLENIPIEHREIKPNLSLNSDESIKTLGPHWQQNDDIFHFQIDFDLHSNQFTKRIVLSTIARLFDPLGWINPIIVTAKVFNVFGNENWIGMIHFHQLSLKIGTKSSKI